MHERKARLIVINDTPTTSSCCGTTAPATATAADTSGEADPVGADDMTTCPVMVGRPVSKRAAVAAGLFRDFEGRRHFFCCAGCGPAFDADPAKYAANLA